MPWRQKRLLIVSARKCRRMRLVDTIHTVALTALLADRLLDVVERKLVGDHALLVDGTRIEAVLPVERVPVDAGRIELPGHTLLPGLIDVHTHLVGQVDDGQGYAGLVTRSGAQEALLGVKHAAQTLRAGFTTVRDIGSFRAFADVALRDAIDGGWVEGPRMMCAGAYLTCPGGGGDITGLAVDVEVPRELRFGVTVGENQMRSNVRQVLANGADFIKVIATGAVLTAGTNPGAPEFTEAEIRAAVEEAAARGTFVAAHAHGAEGIKRAVRAGARSIEHGSLMDDEAIELMVGHDVYLVADLYDSDYIAEKGPSLGYSEEVMRKADATTDSQRVGFRKCVEAGVKLAFGTDAGVFPHGINARQFLRYVKYGLSEIAAIRSATLWAAELMGWQGRVGALQPGCWADVIAVRGNPLEDIGLLESVQFVMKDGVVVKNEV